MKLALSIIFLLISVIMAVVILSQEGKQNGLSGAIGGGNSETYWNKNKKRDKESVMVTVTTILAILFFVLALVLSLGIF